MRPILRKTEAHISLKSQIKTFQSYLLIAFYVFFVQLSSNLLNWCVEEAGAQFRSILC